MPSKPPSAADATAAHAARLASRDARADTRAAQAEADHARRYATDVSITVSQ
jgi:hypothetical protein